MSIDWQRRKYTPEKLEHELKMSSSWTDLSRRLGLVPSGSNNKSLKSAADSLGLDYSHLRGRAQYTVEDLQKAAEVSSSYADTLRVLGITPHGTNTTRIARKISSNSIDISHFTGKSHRKGASVSRKRIPESILVLGHPGDNRETRKNLLHCMRSLGVPYVCSRCDCPPLWGGVPLTLEINHINGESWDNRLGNLEFLCPNCHSQETESNRPRKYSSKPMITNYQTTPKSTRPIPEPKECSAPGCRVEIRTRSIFCITHSPSRSTKIPWPEEDELVKMIMDSSYSSVGRTLGVSDNAIRKRLRNRGYDPKTLEIV